MELLLGVPPVAAPPACNDPNPEKYDRTVVLPWIGTSPSPSPSSALCCDPLLLLLLPLLRVARGDEEVLEEEPPFRLLLSRVDNARPSEREKTKC